MLWPHVALAALAVQAQPGSTPFDAQALTGSSQTQVIPSVAHDAEGRGYVPLSWRDGTRTHFGVARLAAGVKPILIELRPPVEIRHAAVDEQGDLFVLGIDPASYRSRTEPCSLVHRYSADGVRKASFWPCPSGDLRRLQFDLDRSEIRIVSGNVLVTIRGLGETIWFSQDGKPLRPVQPGPSGRSAARAGEPSAPGSFSGRHASS